MPEGKGFSFLYDLTIVRVVCYNVTTNKGEGDKMNTTPKCVECNRVFDLTNEEDAGEFYYGHDCEV